MSERIGRIERNRGSVISWPGGWWGSGRASRSVDRSFIFPLEKLALRRIVFEFVAFEKGSIWIKIGTRDEFD